MKRFISKVKSFTGLNLLSGGSVLSPDQDLLVQKGNRLHELILILVLGYSMVFTVINYRIHNDIQAVITALPIVMVPFEYLLYRKGFPLLSKTLNMVLVTTVVGLLSMVTSPETGVLAFFIPCFLGSLITFQGREQPYAYLLTFLAFLYLIFFLVTDIRFDTGKVFTPEQMRVEWLMNFAGASAATIFQVVFVLLVSNRLQQNVLTANDRYETVVNEVTNDVIWESDIRTGKIQFGSGMHRYFGYTSEQVGDTVEWALSRFHPEDRATLQSLVDECFEKKRSRWEIECRYLTADGSYKFVLDRGYIIFSDDGTPLKMIGALSDITEQKELEKKVIDQKINEQKLITEITIHSQEKEKSELGAELHDNINQILAAAKMYLDLYAAKLPAPDAAIGKSHYNIDLALQEIRKLSHSLVTPTLGNRDLFEAIKDLGSDLMQAAGIEIEYINDLPKETEISETRKLVLYRIVQEHLNNILKYAKATQLNLCLSKKENKVYLTMSDNGVGFDLDKKTKGIGFKNISNRVQLYSGGMLLDTAPGKGCTLEVFIHLN
jgi:two-component system sensor histidine kinase UhpB